MKISFYKLSNDHLYGIYCDELVEDRGLFLLSIYTSNCLKMRNKGIYFVYNIYLCTYKELKKDFKMTYIYFGTL